MTLLGQIALLQAIANQDQLSQLQNSNHTVSHDNCHQLQEVQAGKDET